MLEQSRPDDFVGTFNTNEPAQHRHRMQHPPLSSRYRRWVGSEFLVDADGERPLSNVDALQRQAWHKGRHAHSEAPPKWQAADSKTLLSAVCEETGICTAGGAVDTAMANAIIARYVPEPDIDTLAHLQLVDLQGLPLEHVAAACLRPGDVNWSDVARKHLPRMDAEACMVQWFGAVRPGLKSASKPWSKAEQAALAAAVDTYGQHDWVRVAAFVGEGRHPMDCLKRWATKAHEVSVHQWKPQEDEQLLASAKEHLNMYVAHDEAHAPPVRQAEAPPDTLALPGAMLQPDQVLGDGIQGDLSNAGRWGWMALALPGRTGAGLRTRWHLTTDPAIKRFAFTPWEDAMLVHLHAAYGAGQWVPMALHMPGRTAPQLRERWQNVLDPSIVTKPWSKEEVLHLVAAVRAEGLSRWSVVSSVLSGHGITRSDNQCWQKWNSMQKAAPDLERITFDAHAPPSALHTILRAAQATRGVSASTGRSSGVKRATHRLLPLATPPRRTPRKKGAVQPPSPVSSEAPTVASEHAARGDDVIVDAGSLQSSLRQLQAKATASGGDLALAVLPATDIPAPLSLHALGERIAARHDLAFEEAVAAVPTADLLTVAADVHALVRAAIRVRGGLPLLGTSSSTQTALQHASAGKYRATVSKPAGGGALYWRQDTLSPVASRRRKTVHLSPLLGESSLEAAIQGADALPPLTNNLRVSRLHAGHLPQRQDAPAPAAQTADLFSTLRGMEDEDANAGALRALAADPAGGMFKWLAGGNAASQPAAQGALRQPQWDHILATATSAFQAKAASAPALAAPSSHFHLRWGPSGVPALVAPDWTEEAAPALPTAASTLGAFPGVNRPPRAAGPEDPALPLEQRSVREVWEMSRFSTMDVLCASGLGACAVLPKASADAAGFTHTSAPPSLHFPSSRDLQGGQALTPAVPLPGHVVLAAQPRLAALLRQLPPPHRLFAANTFVQTKPARTGAPSVAKHRTRGQKRRLPSTSVSDTWSAEDSDEHAEAPAAASRAQRPRRSRRATQHRTDFLAVGDDMIDEDGNLLIDLDGLAGDP